MGILSSDEINEIAYREGFKAGQASVGQASRTPIKWPTENEFENALVLAFRKVVANKCEDKIKMMAPKVFEWLKSSVEKEESNEKT